MQGQPGTLGSRIRGAAGAAQAALAVDSWKRKGIVLDVLPSGEVHVVASAEPDAPVTSRHAATVEGEQLRLRGIESSGKPLPSAYVSVLRLRRDGVLLWIPLYGAPASSPSSCAGPEGPGPPVYRNQRGMRRVGLPWKGVPLERGRGLAVPQERNRIGWRIGFAFARSPRT
jgi:hypothetical protein